LNQRTASTTAFAPLGAPTSTTRSRVSDASNAEGFSIVRIGDSSRRTPAALTMRGSPASNATDRMSASKGGAATPSIAATSAA